MEPNKAILIDGFNPSGECHYSDRSGEVVRVSSEDGTIKDAWLCFAELQRLIKFRHRQSQRQSNSSPERNGHLDPDDT